MNEWMIWSTKIPVGTLKWTSIPCQVYSSPVIPGLALIHLDPEHDNLVTEWMYEDIFSYWIHPVYTLLIYFFLLLFLSCRNLRLTVYSARQHIMYTCSLPSDSGIFTQCSLKNFHTLLWVAVGKSTTQWEVRREYILTQRLQLTISSLLKCSAEVYWYVWTHEVLKLEVSRLQAIED